MYAGDLKGNLWKFDLTDSDYHNWNIAYNDADTPKPLFSTVNQPITTKPEVIFHCQKRGYLVLFGTGIYLGQNDLTDASRQTIYGIWDYGDNEDDREYVGDFGAVPLLEQSIIYESTGDDVPVRAISENAAYWSTTAQDPNGVGDNPDPLAVGDNPGPDDVVGWYLDLPAYGERVVSDLFIRDGKLLVNTYIPKDSLCGTGGNSWLMAMDACNGQRLAEAHFDLNGGGEIDEEDLVNIGNDSLPIWMVPAGVEVAGHAQPGPIIDIGDGTGIQLISSAGGARDIGGQKVNPEKFGIIFWRVFQPER